MTKAAAIVGLLVCLFAVVGCKCSGEEAIAELLEAQGQVERDWSKEVGAWKAAEVGATFGFGDGVRAHAASGAKLSLQGNASLRLTPNTSIRFLKEASGGAIGLDVELGQAIFETTGSGLKVATSLGALVIDPNSQVTMRRDGDQIRFEVSLGRLRFDAVDGGGTGVDAGSSIEVSLEGAVLEPVDAGAAVDAEAPEQDDADDQAEITATTTGPNASQRVSGGDWTKLAEGKTTMKAGAGVKVGANTSVVLERGRQRVVVSQGEYVVGLPGGYLVQAVKGSVTLDSRGGRVRVNVPGGEIVARGKDSTASVSIGAKQTRIDVNIGTVDVLAKEEASLRGGESGVLTPDGELEVSGRGPGYADLVVDAGDTFTVHDPKPPTAIGFRLGDKCPYGAVAQIAKKTRGSGVGQVNALVAKGRHSYQVRCLERGGLGDEVVASGSITVVRDAGTRPLPKSAPSTHVNTDGRRYTVLYQNRLPRISVGWASAPKAQGYTLTVNGRSIQTGGPNHGFRPGALSEGTHSVYFSAKTDPPRRSRTTTVVIRFDNASPTATIQSPPDGEFEPGSKVAVSGMAMPGWSVFVGGEQLKLDGNMRFHRDVPTGAEESALPVVFKHPTRGVHYYLRRGKSR